MSPGLVIIGICTIGRVCLWLNELVLAANDVPDTRTRNNAAGEKGEGGGAAGHLVQCNKSEAGL